MSRLTDIQQAIAAMLRASPAIPTQVEILARRDKEVANNIEAALDKLGICLYVMPPMPRQAVKTYDSIAFFGRAEIRIRVIENPQLNLTNFNAWDAMEAVIAALQGNNPGPFFTQPLNLEDRPVEAVEDKKTRVFDIVFDGPFQLQPDPTAQ